MFHKKLILKELHARGTTVSQGVKCSPQKTYVGVQKIISQSFALPTTHDQQCDNSRVVVTTLLISQADSACERIKNSTYLS